LREFCRLAQLDERAFLPAVREFDEGKSEK
jgi:hypothetical protein